VGIPTTWVWAWLLAKRLKSQTWLRKVWVRLEAVQKLFADPLAVREAVYATDELLTSPEAIQQTVDRWPDEYPSVHRVRASSQEETSVRPDPVLGEESALIREIDFVRTHGFSSHSPCFQ